MKLWIDADGCPVTRLAVEQAQKRKIPCAIVCDTAHSYSLSGVEVIVVDQGADSADFALVNRVEKGDLVITQDYGLGAMCLARGCRVLTQNGVEITQQTVDGLLMQRYTAGKMRAAGKHVKGPPKRTREQDEAFLKALIKVIQEEHNG